MKHFFLGILWVVLLSACALLTPSLGHAQIYKGTFRLHLDTQLLGFQFQNLEPDEGPSVKEKSFALGLGKPQIGIGIGAAAADNLVLGARLSGYFASQDNDNESLKTKISHWSILPYLEFIFLEETVRPFVMVALGFLGDVVDGSGDYESSSWLFDIGCGGGIHLFPGNRFSATLSASFAYGIGLMDETRSKDVSRQLRIDRFNLEVLLGISGWF